jgi:hypothetical protein
MQVYTVFARIQAAALIFLNNNKCGLYSSAALIISTNTPIEIKIPFLKQA